MTEAKPTASDEIVSDTDYAEQMLAGKHYRGNPQQLAAFLRLVSDKLAAADPSATAHLQINVLPTHHREVDTIGVAFGIQAETKQMSSGGYHRDATTGPLHIFTSCPPPVTVQREQLLAQLADLDAQIAAESTPHPDVQSPAAAALARQGDTVCAKCGGIAPEHRRGCADRNLTTPPVYDESGFEIRYDLGQVA